MTIPGIILAAAAAALFMTQGDSPIEEELLPQPYDPLPTPLPRPKELRAWGEDALRMNQMDPGSVPAFPKKDEFCRSVSNVVSDSSIDLNFGTTEFHWIWDSEKVDHLQRQYDRHQDIARKNPLAAEEYDSPCLHRFYYYSYYEISVTEPPPDIFQQWNQDRMDFAKNYSGRHDPFQSPEFEWSYNGLTALSSILEEKTFKEGLLAVSRQAVDTDAFLEDEPLRSLLKSAATDDLDRLQQLLKEHRTNLSFFATLTAQEWPGGPQLFSRVLAYLPRDSETGQRQFALKLFFYLDSLIFIRKTALAPLAKESCRLNYQRLFGDDCPFFESLAFATQSPSNLDDIRMVHRIREGLLKYFRAYPLLKPSDLLLKEHPFTDLALRLLLDMAVEHKTIGEKEIQALLETGRQTGLQWASAHSTGEKSWGTLLETVQREKTVTLSLQDLPPDWKQTLQQTSVRIPFEDGIREIQLAEYLQKNAATILLTNSEPPKEQGYIINGQAYPLTLSMALWLNTDLFDNQPWSVLSIIFHETFHNEDLRNHAWNTARSGAGLLNERNAYLFQSRVGVELLKSLLDGLIQIEIQQASLKGKSMTAEETRRTVSNRLREAYGRYYKILYHGLSDKSSLEALGDFYKKISPLDFNFIRFALEICGNRTMVHAANVELGYPEGDAIIRTRLSDRWTPELLNRHPGSLISKFLKDKTSDTKYYMEIYDEIFREMEVH
jgi:hypothetical protein